MLASPKRHFAFSHLRARILFLVLFVTIPAFGLILYTVSVQRLIDAFDIRENVLRLARVAAADHQRLIEGTQQLLTVLTQLPHVRGNNNVAECEKLLAESLQQYPLYTNFGVADLEGNVVCNALAPSEPTNVGDQAWFQRTIKNNRFSIGDYHVSKSTKRAALHFGYPVSDGDGIVDAVVFAAVDLQWLNRFAARARFPEGGILAVVDRNGTILTRYPDKEPWIGNSLSNTSLFGILQTQTEGTVENAALDADGSSRLIGFVPLIVNDEPNAYLLIGIPKETAFAQANYVYSRSLAAMGVIGLLALVVAWIVSELFIMRRVNILTQTTKRLRGGDLSARTNLPYDEDELGHLARAFDQMAQDLRDLYEDLEQKVQKRTHELTQRKQELQEERDQSNAIISSITEGVVVIDHQFRLVALNPAAETMLQVKAKERIGNDLKTCLSVYKRDQELPPQEWPMMKAMTTKSTITIRLEDNFFFKTLSGKTFPVTLSTAPLKGDGITGAVAVFRDATAEKQLEEERSSFIAIASHQLRTPLTSLKWFPEMLLSGDLGRIAKVQKEFLQRVYDETERMINLVTLLLQLTRVEAGHVTIHKIPTDFKQLTENAMMAVRSEWEGKQQRIEIITTPTVLPALPVDPALSQEVLQNLLVNAAHYSPAKSTITVHLTLAEDKRALLVAVEDLGIGIPPAQQEYIFKRFFRADNAIKYVPEGTGLGLHLAKQFVEAWGGKIWFTSHEGKGTTFYFTVPVV